MDRRSFVLGTSALAGAGTLPLPALAQKVSLGAISKYFNAFKTAEAKFTQINGDGSISTGKLYIHRPGRMRFEYDPPDKSLVIAGGGQVGIFDPKSNSNPEQYPLKRTPLSIILARRVDLGRDKMVVGHTTDGTTTTVTAQDPEHPEYGNIKLVFTGSPVELRQWVITNDAGDQTTVILGELTKGKQLSSFLFNITHEAGKWN